MCFGKKECTRPQSVNMDIHIHTYIQDVNISRMLLPSLTYYYYLNWFFFYFTRILALFVNIRHSCKSLMAACRTVAVSLHHKASELYDKSHQAGVQP